jgi:hypothetical protein
MKRIPEHLWVMFWVVMAALTIAATLTLSGCGDDCDRITAPSPAPADTTDNKGEDGDD